MHNNKFSTFSLKVHKFVPIFKTYKLVTFLDFKPQMINRWNDLSSPQIVFGLLILTSSSVLIRDNRYNPFDDD